MAGPLASYLSVLLRHRRLVVLAFVLATLLVGAGALSLEAELQIVEFDVESEATEDMEYLDEHFVTDSGAITLVVVQDEDVITRESFAQTLELQEHIRANETINATLDADRPTADSATVFVEARLRSLGAFASTLEDKQRTFRTFSEEDIQEEFPDTLDDDVPVFGPGTTPSTMLPADHDGSANADARLLFVIHDDVDDEALLDAQLAVEALADEHVEADTFAFGQALVEQRASDATGAAFAALGPLALLFVVVLLLVAYRDLLDAAVALLGVAMVFVWTAGFLGWSGIELTQLLVAVPWLVLGLAIDYGLHVVMRYREELDDGTSARSPPDVDRQTGAMALGLAGVLVAIGVTTATTAAGFLSGAFGPTVVMEFGVVAAVGIVSTFLVFGGFVPALKLELDTLLGRERTSRAIGRISAVERVLGLGVTAAKRGPVVVLVVALALAMAGAYGATQVDTSTDRTDFFPGEPPEWMSMVPGAEIDDDTETLQEQVTFLDERFELAGSDTQAEFLIRGAVTNESGVAAINTIADQARETDVVRGDGNDSVFTPFDVVERFAAFDSDIEDALAAADTTGDGRLDGDVTAAFDATYDLDSDAMNVSVARDGGGYYATRVVVPTQSGADSQDVASEMRAIADQADDEPGIEVSVTGGPVVTADAQTALLRTLVESFLIALAVTLGLLVLVFWRRYRALRLGLATVVPVLVALAWTLGTMALLDIPYNAETAIITGIAIGLGVDYAIHVSVRFRQETVGHDVTGSADEQADSEGVVSTSAIDRAVRDTGGTLFASAATTAVALSVLVFTFVPSLQRFGIVMVLVVTYAFLASVFVLPSILVLTERFRSE